MILDDIGYDCRYCRYYASEYPISSNIIQYHPETRNTGDRTGCWGFGHRIGGLPDFLPLAGSAEIVLSSNGGILPLADQHISTHQSHDVIENLQCFCTCHMRHMSMRDVFATETETFFPRS